MTHSNERRGTVDFNSLHVFDRRRWLKPIAGDQRLARRASDGRVDVDELGELGVAAVDTLAEAGHHVVWTTWRPRPWTEFELALKRQQDALIARALWRAQSKTDRGARR